jgi:hypothetical protein
MIALGVEGKALMVITVLPDVTVGIVAHAEFEVNSTVITSAVFNPAFE